MADSLPAEQRASYAAIIDDILKDADLEQISAKAVRRLMQERIPYDIEPQKKQIQIIIVERFDKLQEAQSNDAPATTTVPAPTANGYHAKAQNGQTAQKRKAESEADDSDLSDAAHTPAPKKVKQFKAKSETESDEAFAAKLQAEFNAQDRPTRGAGQKKRGTVKREKKSKKRSARRVGSDLDSDVDGSAGEVKEKKGAFHKPFTLSEPLAAMLNESVLSRPQTVKKIWEYVKSNDLQDPADKRQFICDPPMRAVFKQDKVHMFTMNRLLGAHLYPVEES